MPASSGSMSAENSLNVNSIDSSNSDVAEVEHAVHCFLYSPTADEIHLETESDDMTKLRAIVLMHLRFDGLLGFPGGMVDNPVNGLSETEFHRELAEALQRELIEELGMTEAVAGLLTHQNYMFANEKTRPNGTKLIMHFYAFQLELSVMNAIERSALNSKEYGLEVMGNVRVPLYTMNDGFRGFPAFLTNGFAGASRQQLLSGLERLGIMTQSEIEKAVASSLQREHSKP